jgi:glycerol-3-phosphate dehydrogenase (NAD+)
MWVFEEYVKEEEGKWVRPARGAKPPEGKTWVDEGYTPLTEVINTKHENVIYLPGIPLPTSIVAQPDVQKAVTGATMMVFVIPHNFLAPIVPKMSNVFSKDAIGISLIKGIEFADGKPILISDLLKEEMGKAEGSPSVDMSVLMGANVANEVAKGDFAEATIGCTSLANGEKWVKLFNTSDFKVDPVEDVAGAELCGALKNVVALGAGFCDGLGFGGNTKAAIIRIGLKETIKFAKMFFDGVKDDTFLESCGLADLVTTCYGGRNRKCAEAFAKKEGDWDALEKKMLNGQKLQGTITAKDVMVVLREKGLVNEFPLFSRIHEIAFEGKPAETLIEVRVPRRRRTAPILPYRSNVACIPLRGSCERAEAHAGVASKPLGHIYTPPSLHSLPRVRYTSAEYD